MRYLTRAISARRNAAKRERHRERVAAAIAKQEAEFAAQAARLGCSVLEYKRALAMSAEQAAEAPARARAQRHTELEARDAALHRQVDATLADAAAFRAQDAAAALRDQTVFFIDSAVEERVHKLQRDGKRDEAARVIAQAVKDGVAAICEVPA